MPDASPELTLVDPGHVDSVLVVTAHPDDVDFGAAGSVAAFVEAGVSVSYCIVTDGDAGGSDLDQPRHEMAALRRQEQLAAATEVGVHEVTFLGYPDGRLTANLELRRDISREIRRVRPQLVVTQSPERNFERIFASHPDHLAAGEATLCAVYPDARNPFAHPELLEEGYEPFTVPEVWLMASPHNNRAVEITGTFDRKLRALRRHKSQVGDGEHLEGLLRGWFGPQAVAAGLPEGSFAEIFRAIVTH